MMPFLSTRNHSVIAAVFFCTLFLLPASAQDHPDNPAYLYRPQNKNEQDTMIIRQSGQTGNNAGVENSRGTSGIDQDSLDARLRFIEDSVRLREQFIRDSILVREAFVRDSIARRQRVLDSLNVFVLQLPRLLDASYKAISDQIIFRSGEIVIVGDSTLSNYSTFMLTFDFTSPYTPWKSTLNLSDRPPEFTFDKGSGKITAIRSPQFDCSYSYTKNDAILLISTKSSILSKNGQKLYKEPVDSVFFDRQGRVTKVKKYVRYYQAVNDFQRGTKLFSDLEYVKQFEYNPAGQMIRYEVTKFCDRSGTQAPVKVCTITTYIIHPLGTKYLITRQNNPENEYSDGTFTYEFSTGNTLISVAFQNKRLTENWKNIIEVNEDGNVSRYLYEKDGIINQTLLIHYNDDPKAKNRVEKVSCSFEKDGISYFQKNVTTGKTRTRDRLTMEWGPWE